MFVLKLVLKHSNCSKKSVRVNNLKNVIISAFEINGFLLVHTVTSKIFDGLINLTSN